MGLESDLLTRLDQNNNLVILNNCYASKELGIAIVSISDCAEVLS